MTTCAMPGCHRPPDTTNRDGQTTCTHHRLVVVSGSWVGNTEKDHG